MEATIHGNKEVCKILLDAKANVNSKAMYNLTPLCIAALFGHVDICRLFIERGAAVAVTTAHGWTPLYLAALGGNRKLCTMLVQANSSPGLWHRLLNLQTEDMFALYRLTGMTEKMLEKANLTPASPKAELLKPFLMVPFEVVRQYISQNSLG